MCSVVTFDLVLNERFVGGPMWMPRDHISTELETKPTNENKKCKKEMWVDSVCALSGSRTRTNCLEGNYPTVGPTVLDDRRARKLSILRPT
jgi:hypothetical protein